MQACVLQAEASAATAAATAGLDQQARQAAERELLNVLERLNAVKAEFAESEDVFRCCCVDF